MMSKPSKDQPAISEDDTNVIQTIVEEKTLDFHNLDMLISSHLFSFFFFLFTFFPVFLLHLTNSYDITRDFLALNLFELSHSTT